MPLSFPALDVQVADIPGVLREAEALKTARTRNRLLEMQMGQAQAEQNRLAQFGGMVPDIMTGDPRAIGRAAALDPEMTARYVDVFSKLDERQRDSVRASVEKMGNLALGVLTAPGVQRPMYWQQARQAAIESGADPASIPEAYGPETEMWLRSKVAEAGEIKTLLDEAEQNAPAGYRPTESGDLAYIPGGPADPSQARRLAEAKRAGEGVTPKQEAINTEIEAARRTIKRKYPNLDAEEIARKTTEKRASGLDNREYDENLAVLLRKATRRKVGDDPEFETLYRQWYGEPAPDIPEPEGVGQLESFGTGPRPTAPAPTRRPYRGAETTSQETRPGRSPVSRFTGRKRDRSQDRTMAQILRLEQIETMSIDGIAGLLNQPGVSLSEEERNLIDQRLRQLGR